MKVKGICLISLLRDKHLITVNMNKTHILKSFKGIRSISSCFQALSNSLSVFVFTRKGHFCGINQIQNSMFLADNFGMFHWELSYFLGKESCISNPQSFLYLSEEKYSKTAMHRVNDSVYLARHSAGNFIIEIKEGKIYATTI